MSKSFYRLTGWSGLVLLAVLGATAPFAIRDILSPVLPARLGAMTLSARVSGTDAAAIVNRMHGEEVAQAKNFIGLYSSMAGNATVYASIFSSPSAAQSAVLAMSSRISGGAPEFSHYREFSSRGQQVSMCTGLGQIHYFFARGRTLYWIAVDPPVAAGALQRLLDFLER
jgi:hypothetical protein